MTIAAMESTSTYWKPPLYCLEEVMEVWLLNAAHMKAVPGRKTDVRDAEWIAQTVLWETSDDVNSDYRLTFQSLPQDGVPGGKYLHFRWTSHTVYPGVTSSVCLYLPHGAEEAESVNLMVFLDGRYYVGEECRATTVLDNLVHAGEIPMTVGLFHQPGETGPGYPVYGGTTNRAVEYDTVNGDLARYLVEELFPVIRTKVRLTDDPKGRVICGHSSGGAGAFSAAFHRPDVFGNVISHCGSFINILGANNLPSMVQRAPHKPIRVWHQSGARDVDIIFGNIPIANHDLDAALKYRRYDSMFVFGTGGHTLRHAGEALPETPRWIFRGSGGRQVTPDSEAQVATGVAGVGATESVQVEFDVPAAMRDGVVLRADVSRPAGRGPWPTLVVRTPYDKTDAAGNRAPRP